MKSWPITTKHTDSPFHRQQRPAFQPWKAGRLFVWPQQPPGRPSTAMRRNNGTKTQMKITKSDLGATKTELEFICTPAVARISPPLLFTRAVGLPSRLEGNCHPDLPFPRLENGMEPVKTHYFLIMGRKRRENTASLSGVFRNFGAVKTNLWTHLFFTTIWKIKRKDFFLNSLP